MGGVVVGGSLVRFAPGVPDVQLEPDIVLLLFPRSRGYQRVVREVLDAQRRRVVELRDEGAISDDVLHALEREFDLEDDRLEI
jgi:hypothetical protein